jgi:uncharacterized metal-binding protein YceD (DUF177 family)
MHLGRKLLCMKVSFHEIKDEDLHYSFTETTPWIMEVIGSLDERQDRIQRPPNWKPRSRPTEVNFTLRHVEDLVHVTAKVKTNLFLTCSLCGDTFSFPVHTHFHVLLTQSEMYGNTSREKSHKGAFSHEDPGFEADEDEDDSDDQWGDDDDDSGAPMDFNSSDFEISVVKEPIADLKELLHEQITLIIPMQPKHPEGECKGPVLSWTDSQAKEPLKENPFAVLKNFKKKPE